MLDVELNGTATGLLAEFIERDGQLLSKASELRELGLRLAAPDAELVLLASLPGVVARVDRARQALVLSVPPEGLEPKRLEGRSSRPLPPLSPAEWGAVLNYDAFGTYTAGLPSATISPELRLGGPYGLVNATGLVFLGQRNMPAPERRLDTAWTFGEEEDLRRWRVGDLTPGGVAWSRPVRLGGVQVASDFNMRPDLLRFAAPNFAGQAAVPSTVDVLVNGVKQFSQSVPPGPFEIRSLPVVTGTGDVVVAVRDATGRQTLTTLPFFASTQLQAEGLTSYSLEAGRVRLGYGTPTTQYVSWGSSASARHGLTDWLTLQGHGEATDGLNLLGGGAALRAWGLGAVSLDVAGSQGRGAVLRDVAQTGLGSLGKRPGEASGTMGTLGVHHGRKGYNINLTATVVRDGYRDTAALFGSGMPRRVLRASLGLPLGDFGSLNMAWTDQRGATGGYSLGRVSLINASYSKSLFGALGLSVSGYRDMVRSTTGVFVGLTYSLGGYSSGASFGQEAASRTYTQQVQRPATRPGEFGFSATAQEGATAREMAEAQYFGESGRVAIAGDHSGRSTSGRATASGALVVAGGSAFLANQVDDSFAVVRTGSVGGVPVMYENRPIGRTREDGRLLVPFLRSYDGNRLAIEAIGLPADVEVEATERMVRPVNGAGVLVDFGVRKIQSALVRLVRPDGKAVPRGAMARVSGRAEVPVGRDGRTYLTGLDRQNEVSVELPGGQTCKAVFDFVAVSGQIPTIGPVPCT